MYCSLEKLINLESSKSNNHNLHRVVETLPNGYEFTCKHTKQVESIYEAFVRPTKGVTSKMLILSITGPAMTRLQMFYSTFLTFYWCIPNNKVDLFATCP